MSSLDFKQYYRSLSRHERQEFARRAGTTDRYIDLHLATARKKPRPETIHKLAMASNGQLDENDLAAWFFKEHRKREESRVRAHCQP